MDTRKTTAILALSNFAASFGGGGLLAKGLTSLAMVPGFRADSMLAYLVGTSLSLVGILGCRSAVRRAGAYLSLAGAAVVLGLALGFEPLARAGSAGAWTAFGLLCVTFALIFVPRTLRADWAAGASHRLPWLELAYGSGYLVSLLAWRGFPDASFSASLDVATGLLALSGLLDLVCSRAKRPAVAEAAPGAAAAPEATSGGAERGVPALVTAFAATTIVVQVGSQRLSAVAGDSLPLIAFHAGVLAAPLIAIFSKLTLAFAEARERFALRVSFLDGRGKGPALGTLVVATLVAMTAALAGAWGLGARSAAVFLALCAVATLYELTAILLLEAIGHAAKRAGGVAVAFGVTGFAATCAYAGFLSLDFGTRELVALAGAASLGAIVSALCAGASGRAPSSARRPRRASDASRLRPPVAGVAPEP